MECILLVPFGDSFKVILSDGSRMSEPCEMTEDETNTLLDAIYPSIKRAAEAGGKGTPETWAEFKAANA